jgi:hypothetical protein
MNAVSARTRRKTGLKRQRTRHSLSATKSLSERKSTPIAYLSNLAPTQKLLPVGGKRSDQNQAWLAARLNLQRTSSEDHMRKVYSSLSLKNYTSIANFGKREAHRPLSAPRGKHSCDYRCLGS